MKNSGTYNLAGKLFMKPIDNSKTIIKTAEKQKLHVEEALTAKLHEQVKKYSAMFIVEII